MAPVSRTLKLVVIPGQFAICRLPLDSELEMWFLTDRFFALLRSDGELTVVCAQEKVPESVEQDRDWSALKIDGSFDFTETGVLNAVLTPLAEAQIGIFALSVFKTDYVLVKTEYFQTAKRMLEQAGHIVSG